MSLKNKILYFFNLRKDEGILKNQEAEINVSREEELLINSSNNIHTSLEEFVFLLVSLQKDIHIIEEKKKNEIQIKLSKILDIDNKKVITDIIHILMESKDEVVKSTLISLIKLKTNLSNEEVSKEINLVLNSFSDILFDSFSLNLNKKYSFIEKIKESIYNSFDVLINDLDYNNIKGILTNFNDLEKNLEISYTQYLKDKNISIFSSKLKLFEEKLDGIKQLLNIYQIKNSD